MSGRLGSIGAVLAISCCGVLACEEEAGPPSTDPAKKAAAEEQKKPVVDSKIARAMASATAAQNASPASELAPPPNGILSPAQAEKQAPKGQPAQLVLGSAGSEPRVNLSSAGWAAETVRKGKVTLQARTAGGVMPHIDVAIEGRHIRKKTEPGAVPSVERNLTAIELQKATLSAQQPGRLPPSAAESIAILDGSTVEFTADDKGAVLGVKVLPKTDSPEVRPMLDEVAAAFSNLRMPYPDKAVGPGGYWMVTSRESFGGVDSVAYRMLRVTAVTGKTAEIDIKTRRYLTTPQLGIAGLPPHTVRQFQGEGTGSFTIVAGSTFPIKAQLKESLLAMVAPNDRPQQALPLQTESQVTLQWDAAPETSL